MNKLIIICGSPGSGKSTYAKKLASIKPAVVIDIDTCTETLVRKALILNAQDPDDRDSEYFKANFRTPIYDTLFEIAYDNLPYSDVLIVGPFTKEIRDLNWPNKLKEKFNTIVEVHYVHCSPEVRKIRVKSRANQRDRYKIKDWDKTQEYYGNEEPPVFEHILVEN